MKEKTRGEKCLEIIMGNGSEEHSEESKFDQKHLFKLTKVSSLVEIANALTRIANALEESNTNKKEAITPEA